MLSCKTQYYTFVYENALLLGNDKYQVFKEKSLADVAKLEFHHPDSKEILHSNVLPCKVQSAANILTHDMFEKCLQSVWKQVAQKVRLWKIV